VALSDEGQKMAFPKAILPNSATIISEIGTIVKEESVQKIILGDPGDNLISEDVRRFAKSLEETLLLPVVLEKEFMTSSHVSQFTGTKPIARLSKKEIGVKRDDSAAALILQRYLDKHHD
jgi:RNase H-fold protein (predicted Holliday junction resolvase)